MVRRVVTGLNYENIASPYAFPNRHRSFTIWETINVGIAQFYTNVVANLLGQQPIRISRKNLYAIAILQHFLPFEA
jgi:hypothetical protein